MALKSGVENLSRILIGSSIMAAAAIMLIWHLRTWRKYASASSDIASRPSDPTEAVKSEVDAVSRQARLSEMDESARRREELVDAVDTRFELDTNRYYCKQSKHRCYVAVMIGLTGFILAALGWVQHPTVFTVGLLIVFALIVGIVGGALIDAFRTQAFFRKHDHGFRIAKEALVDEYTRLKKLQQQQTGDGVNAETTSKDSSPGSSLD